MAAAKLDIYIEQGSTFKRTLKFKMADGVTPLDISGNTFRGQIRQGISDAAIVASFTCTITNGPGGEVDITLTAAQTSAIELKPQKSPYREPQDFSYDVERVLPDTTVERVLEGLAKISPEVTR